MDRITIMKWLEVARFELVYQLRRPSTWIVLALFLLPLIGVTSDSLIDARNREILFHAPVAIAESSVFMSLIALLILAGVAGDAATRDVQTRVEPLMHAAPVGRAAYLGGRFVGAFAVVALLLTVVPLVRMVLPLVHAGAEAELLGPFRPAAYIQSYLLLIVPNAFTATAFMFALALLVRHTLGSYIGAALVLVGAQLSGDVVGGRLGRWDLAGVLDSTGVIALEVMARTWSPIELNERLVGTEGALLWNRLLWLVIAIAVLVITYRRFDFGGKAGAIRCWLRGRVRAARRRHGAAGERPGSPADAAATRNALVTVPPASPDFSPAGRARQALAITRDSLREVWTAWSWLLVPYLVLQVALTVSELNVLGAGTPVLPTTDRILGPFEDLPPPVVILPILLLVLMAGELVWRERDANMHALADAAPVPDGVLLAGKLLGLLLLIVAFHALLMLTGIASQIVLGWYDFDIGLYLRILFGLELVDALVFGMLALSVHVLVSQKHVGHLVVLLLIVGLNGLAPLLGIEHPLLLYGSEPGWRYSPISGFGPFVAPVLWFELYWAAWTLLLALVARLFWVRGVERRLTARVRIARRRFRGRTAAAVAAVLALILLVGGFIFYNTNVLNDYRPTAEGARRQAEYERRYARYQHAPQPRMTATELDVEIDPDRREAEVRGVHHLSNRTAQPIDTIHIAISTQVATGEMDFGREARAVVVDDELGHRIYVLDEPLQPGDSLRLSWRVRHAPRGFPARGISTAVVGNGSFIVMPAWTPLIGYQPRRELSDPGERRAQGLPPRPAVPSLYDVRARRDPTGQERIEVEATVGTAADQVAVAPGELLRTWTRDGRRYFHYATAAPIGNEYAIFSADYEVREARQGDVALEILHHPAHDRNVRRMLRGMAASLEQFTERFGPYPYRVLRMVEYPSAGGSLHAAPGSIWYQELFSLFDPARDPRRIDLPFAVVAHEVAHQFQPRPASVEGRALLSESFAWYAALGVIEQEYGTEHLARFLGFMRESYLTPRSRADVPLLRATDFFLAYRKGPFAMYALREYVGQERVDRAWRRLRARHASGEPPFATSLDLLRELQDVTPDSLHDLLSDLLERNTFWELRTREASARRTDGGEWQVTLDVVARKVAVDTAGAETEMPMNDLIEIGVFAPARDDGEPAGRPLYRAKHRVRTGPQTITVTVPARPARAGIDPRHLLIDVQPGDNVVGVEDAGASPAGDGAPPTLEPTS